MTNDEMPEFKVEPISLKQINFWPSNPDGWFQTLELQLAASRISDDTSRYTTVLSMLSSDIIDKCMDIIKTVPAERKYAYIKNHIIKRFSESAHSRLQKLFAGEDLGDRKPSELLNRLKTLSGDSVQEDVLKSLWIQRLPTQTQAILAGTSGSLETQSEIADRIAETLHQSVSAIQHPTPSASTSSCQTSDNSIQRQIEALSAKFDRLAQDVHSQDNRVPRSRSRSNFNVRFRRQSRSRSRYNGTDNNKLCFYHRKFGANANFCRKPCTFNAPQKN